MKILQSLLLSFFTVVLLTACENYGKKTANGHVEVYYKEGITREDAQKTADFMADLDRTQNNNSTEKKGFQLCKKGDTIHLRMVANIEKLSQVSDNAFFALGYIVSQNVFHGAPVNLDLTDPHFKTFKTFHFKKTELNRKEQE